MADRQQRREAPSAMWARAWRVARNACFLGVAAMVCGCLPGGRTGGVVIVESKPVSGALVKVGTDTIGLTPCRIEGYAPGITGVTLMRDGYQRTSKTIQIPEDGEVTVVVELLELAGYLTITSRPAHAKVILDDAEELGYTPMPDRPVPLGSHRYTVLIEDYEPAAGTLVVEDGISYVFHHQLKPLDAQVTIISRPTGAQVYINDRTIDTRTPAKINLPPGDYTIAAYMDGYVMGEQGVRLEANAEVSAEFDLVKGNVPEGMVIIPAGEFVFGHDNEAPDERPAKRVYLPEFFIDKFEVTNAEYKKVVPTHTFPDKEGLLPVTRVTWKQATDYAAAAGKRLPTEEEWEKAARGPEGLEYPWANRFDGDRLNYRGTNINAAADIVGSFRAGASPYGCMDMAGNVFEWTADWYEPYPGNPIVDVTYGQNYRVLRGGSFRSEAFETRSARRHYDRPANTRDDYGFRCVKDPGPRQE